MLKNSSNLFLHGYSNLEFKRRNCVQGHDIRETGIVDLVRYCLMPYNQDIPEPAGLRLLKGLAELEIDKSLIANGRVLTRLARKDHVSCERF